MSLADRWAGEGTEHARPPVDAVHLAGVIAWGFWVGAALALALCAGLWRPWAGLIVVLAAATPPSFYALRRWCDRRELATAVRARAGLVELAAPVEIPDLP